MVFGAAGGAHGELGKLALAPPHDLGGGELGVEMAARPTLVDVFLYGCATRYGAGGSLARCAGPGQSAGGSA